MPGRLQKVAALAVAAFAFAASAFAEDTQGPGARFAAISLGGAQRDGTLLELSDANATERWSLMARASRTDWTPADVLAFPRFDWRAAVTGDVARANLAFDWQRRLAAGRLGAHAFAARFDAGLADNASAAAAALSPMLVQRLRETAFGAGLRWEGLMHTVSARLRGTSRDAEGGATDERGELRLAREDRVDETSLAFDAASQVALPAGIRAEAGLRYGLYRARVRSDLEAHAGEVSAHALSPRLRLRMPVPMAGEMFLTVSRGARDRDLSTMTDPRSGAPVARLDPLTTVDTFEVGLARRWPYGVETTISMFRAKSELEVLLNGENAITEFSRPTVRQGIQLAARFEPAPWLTMDFQAAALHARFADGAAEYIPGAAERNASAAATIRVPHGWTASLLVNYLGKRYGLEESSSVRASTFVNGRLTRNLTKSTRLYFDVFNIFDQRLRDVDYFSATRAWSPEMAAPRGLRIQLRTTF